MMVMKKTIVTFLMVMLCSLSAFAQVDRREVRAGNRAFKKGEFGQSEVDYKKALLKDSTSVAAQYNLANALYKLENYTEAEKYSKAALDSLSRSPRAADAHYNSGDIYLQQRRWSEAIEAFKSSLRLNPDDMDAKSNLAYAQKMLQNEQQQNQDGDGENNQQNDQNQDQDQNNDQNQNQDQNQDQNKDQDKQDDQNKDQNKDDQQQNPDQNQDQDQQPPKDQPQQDQKISPEAAEQMLQAIQAKEDETQEKVKKEKAAAVKSRQKEKNW